MMSVLARQQARQSGNLPPLEFPPAADSECPLIPKKPFALPNLALDAARATADARRSRHASADGRLGLQCRHCMATRPGRGQQPCDSRWRRGCMPGWASYPRPRCPVHHRALRALTPNSLRGIFYTPTYSGDSRSAAVSCSGHHISSSLQ